MSALAAVDLEAATRLVAAGAATSHPLTLPLLDHWDTL
jgi:hypothetical protein